MLPLSLTLQNFMSYGDEPVTLELRGMDVICLSGDNGHGKSAILDAITYALWGETRLGKQGHDQLIRLGADEMAVVFDFQLGANLYRVRRQRTRKGSGQIWEIQAIEEDGTLRPLTGLSTSDTGRVITRLLRMNYDTFLNSAYLKQGKADEFVKQTATRRKDILAEILDLSRYDELEALARIKAREWTDRKLDAERTLKQIESVIAEEPEIREEATLNDQELARLQTESESLASKIEATNLRLALIDSKKREHDENLKRIASLDNQIRELSKSIESDKALCNEAAKLLGQKDQILRDYKLLQDTQSSIEKLTSESEHLNILERDLTSAQQSMENQKRELESHLKLLSSEFAKLEKELAAIPELHAESDQAKLLQTQIDQSKTDLSTHQKSRDILVQEMAELKAKYNLTNEKLDILEQRSVKIASLTDVCSVCGSPLSPKQIEEISEQIEAERTDLLSLQSELKRAGSANKSKLSKLDEEIKLVQAFIDANEPKRARLLSSERRLSELLSLKSENYPSLKKQISDSKSHLNSPDFAAEDKLKINKLSVEISALSSSRADLQNARATQKSLEPVVHAHARLINADRDHTAAQERLTRNTGQQETLKAEHNRLSSSLTDIDSSTKEAADINSLLVSQKQQLTEVTKLVSHTQNEQGRFQNRLEQIQKAIAQKAAREVELKSAEREALLHTELAVAFSKRGVQALIIDTAMPELESDASELLGRLTDGSMNLLIQTQKAAKSKTTDDDLVETLDIIVRDDLGERALEMYSGGESFRVSFALRIGLSKLLARRAGADLQTLIIDEGFGSQDASGREKLVDAIMAIRTDFAQIIVITHVDELKDAFANRIEIIKTPSGSQANMILGSAIG